MQENIPENQKYRIEKLDKQYQININLIFQTSLDQEIIKSLKQDEKIEVVLALKSIHLQWLNINKIVNLDVFTNLNILYLQHNNIRKIQNLQALINLQYLALNNNYITKVQNLQNLKKLLGLNLNYNQIDQIDYIKLPNKIQLISFKNNPICLDVSYKINLLKYLPDLQMLDDINVTPQQKFKSLGIFPTHLLDYANKMKQFRSKKQIQQKLNKHQQLLLGDTVNQKQALNQIRQKTRKYLHQSKQSFKEQTKQQIQNFQQRIKVSKKIRNIKEKQQENRKKKIKQMKQIHQQTQQTQQ